MSTQETLILVAVVAFVAGWSISRACLRAELAKVRETAGKARARLDNLRADLRELSDDRYKAGFAAGVAAYPDMNDEGRRDVLEAWRPSK